MGAAEDLREAADHYPAGDREAGAAEMLSGAFWPKFTNDIRNDTIATVQRITVRM